MAIKKTSHKIMDITADLAHKEYKNRSFSFYELVDLLAKKSFDVDTADLYISMIEDNRFLSIGKQNWKLSSSFKFEDAEKIKMSMFGDKEAYVEEVREFGESMTDEERELAYMEDFHTEDFQAEEVEEEPSTEVLEEEEIIKELDSNFEDGKVTEDE